jgi:cell pole-organizing protein PopZ
MAETTQNQEPSMEEILASIRKIISEDGATVETVDTADDILELTEEVQSEPVADASEEPRIPVVEMEDTPPPPPPLPREPEVAPANLDLGDSLISQATAEASASALGDLASMMKNGSSHSISSFPIGDGGRTLESMVLELIKPYLKGWLDENLPTLVERIVQKEIQKITRDMN